MQSPVNSGILESCSMTKRSAQKPPIILLVARVMFAATVGALALCTVLGELGTWHWVLDLLSHFRLQYLVSAGLLILLSTIGFRQARLIPLSGVLLAGFCFAYTAMFFIPRSIFVAQQEQPVVEPIQKLRVMFANIHYGHPDIPKIVAAIEVQKPDIIMFAEIQSSDFLQLLQQLHEYPFSQFIPPVVRRNPAHVLSVVAKDGLISNFKMLSLDGETPTIEFTVAKNGKNITIIGDHTIPPMSQKMSLARNKNLEGLAEKAAATTTPLLILGDLNITHFSPVFTKMLTDGKLLNARRTTRGGAAQNTVTWPTFLPSFMGIPIDHALVNASVAVTDFSVGPETGSDHLPITVSVEF